ncbi:Helicase [Giardia duodenalis]|uniref:ATP-dependent RNA helicase n=1 Tax=Giardia intestinalis (strain ATCC 50803 / WB clone C6) TaxID=184922 RepID=A8B6E0_GIAIC|nr:Helicase [Giardia intestinalis]KAE8304982.1 Helicase [Giardia intestinalis]|eukprot:XP_001709450.1 Hypothetical protein GL50803_6283 [Giardia lamblia ATCC 50803]
MADKQEDTALLPVDDKIDLFDDTMSWEKLSVPESIMELLHASGFHMPTKTQVAAIKPILCDRKRSGLLEAPTGTGKTISFLTVAMSHITPDKSLPQAVIIAPTKILCRQIYGVAENLAKGSNIRVSLCFAKDELNEGELNPTAHIVIGTIHSLLNNFSGKIVVKGKTRIAERATFDCTAINTIIIDEADYFIENKHEISKFIEIAPKKTRRYLYSATMPSEVVDTMVKEWLDVDNPYFVERVNIYLGNSVQFSLCCTEADKTVALDKVINLEIYKKGAQSIIFCKTRKFVDECYRVMKNAGYSCSRYHSDMSKEAKMAEFEKFRKRETNCLITTDGLARGIDVATIRLVVNYNPPVKWVNNGDEVADPTLYTHRIGRGGRFGKATVSITLYEKDTEEVYMNKIIEHIDEKYATQKRTEHVITSLDSVDEIKEKVESIVRKVDDEISREIDEQNKKTEKRNEDGRAERRDDVEGLEL